MSDNCEHILCGTTEEVDGDDIVVKCRGCGVELIRKHDAAKRDD